MSRGLGDVYKRQGVNAGAAEKGQQGEYSLEETNLQTCLSTTVPGRPKHQAFILFPD